MIDPMTSGSPRWNWTTKLLVGMCFAVIFGFLLAHFRNYIGPLLLVFILTYLSYPMATKIRDTLHISWRLAVTLFYLVVVLLLIGLLTLSGLALVEQAQSLYNLIYNAITNQLPQLIDNLTSQAYMIGPFTLDLTQYNISSLNDQILGYVQPILGQVGTLVTAIASGAAGFIGWVGFVLLISYFITSESQGTGSQRFILKIPGHTDDIQRITAEINTIWNAFLRGQIVLFLLTVAIYTFLLTVLQVRYSLGLALLAGLGRFLPYIGPAIAWTAYALVSLFQGHTIFWLPPWVYAATVVGLAVLVDTMFDNFISPKILGQALKVHPAAVLISALILANLIGVVGVLLAAPVLATMQLLFHYTMRKMFDQDPWEGMEYMSSVPLRHTLIPEPVWQWMVEAWDKVSRWVVMVWASLVNRFRRRKAVKPPE